MQAYRSSKKGFTLVEILIVVIILGILAAIVIPQFTNASEDARKSSLTSQLQTIRSQVELYKLQHRDAYPTSNNLVTGTWSWDKLSMHTLEDGTLSESGTLGPYLQSKPINALTGGSNMVSATTDTAAHAVTTNLTGANPDGFSFSQATGKIWAYDKLGAIFTEN